MIGLLLNPKALMALAMIAAIAGAGWQGYQMGYAASEHRHAVEKLALKEAARKLDEDRRAKANEIRELADKLEAEANEDPVAVPECVGPDRVQRLNRLR